MLADLRAAASLLTRLPVGGGQAPTEREVWAYPAVGAALGVLAAAFFALARAGLPANLAALLCVASTILLTGGLHEDGLADAADGMGGGATRARKLEIMRDSRIGSFGALALILSVAVRAGSIATLDTPARAAAALVAAHAGARASIAVLLYSLPPARSDGMAATVAYPPRRSVIAAVVIAATLAAALMPVRTAIGAAVACCLATAGMGALARAQIGGHTGDVLGAAEQLAECAILLAAVVTQHAD